MKIRLATPDDKEEWNEVVLQDPNGTYAHTWEWKEVLEKGLGIESLHLVAEDAGKIVGIYPGFIIPIRTLDLLSPLTSRFKILQSPFDATWDYGGPCVLPAANSQILDKLIIEMEKFAKKKGAISLRVSPFEGDMLKEKFISRGYRVSPRLTSIIDLTKREDELFSNIQKQARQILKKMNTTGAKVVEACNIDGLKGFYFECLEDLRVRTGIYLPPYSFFEVLLNIFGPKKMLSLTLVEYDNKVIGGSLHLLYKDMAVLRFLGGAHKYRELYPHYILYWEQIKKFKSRGFKKIDQGGLPSDRNSGLYLFKSKWGGEIKNVDWYVKDLRFKAFRRILRKCKLNRLIY